jgi:hypothetical protein
MRHCSFVLLAALLLLACVNRVEVNKPWGESAKVWMSDGTEREGELLSVASTSLLMADAQRPGVSEIPWSNVECVRIKDYSQMGLRVAGMVPTCLAYTFTAIAMVASLSSTANALSFIPMLAAGGTVWTFLAGDPKVQFGPTFDGRTISALRVYCRYPFGLTEEQLAQLRALNR